MAAANSAAPIFTSSPDGANARAFRTELNGRIKSDIAKFARVSSRSLPTQSAALEAAVSRMQTGSRVSPLLFFWHQDLLAALQAQHLDGARTALERLTELAPHAAEMGPPLRVDTVAGSMHEALTRIAASHTVTGDSPDVVTRVEPLEAERRATFGDWVTHAADRIGAADPDLLGEIRELVSEVRVYQGQGPRGVTSVLAFGAVFLRWPNNVHTGPAYVLETLVHEAAHLALYAVMSVDPLILNGYEGTFASPLRKDPRPLYGIFHQTFVLARLCRLWDKLIRVGEAWAEAKLVEDHRLFLDGYRVIHENAQLTPAGNSIVASMRRQ